MMKLDVAERLLKELEDVQSKVEPGATEMSNSEKDVHSIKLEPSIKQEPMVIIPDNPCDSRIQKQSNPELIPMRSEDRKQNLEEFSRMYSKRFGRMPVITSLEENGERYMIGTEVIHSL